MRKFLLLFTVIILEIVSTAEIDLFIPGFPAMQSEFGLSSFLLEATLSLNFLGYCIGLFYVGKLADSHGRKNVLIAGLAVFILGSLICLSTNNYSIVLLGRFLQGFGATAPGVITFLIIADSFPIHKQQFYLGVLNGIANISVGAAPLVGSYITLYYGWRGNFSVLLLAAAFAIVLTTIFVTRNTRSKAPENTDYMDLICNKKLMIALSAMQLQWTPYWVFTGMAPLLYMQTLSVDITHYGYYQGSLAMVFAIGSIISGFVMKLISHKKLMRLSLFTTFLGLLLLAWATVTNSHNPLFITVAMVIYIMSTILPTNIIFPHTLNIVPLAKGRVMSLTQALKLITTAIALEITGYFYIDSFVAIGLMIISLVVIGTYLLILTCRMPGMLDSQTP